MRYVSIFSGIEAASVAWVPLGWEPVCFSEIEPFPCAVLRERFPGVPNLGDITKIDWKGVRRANGPVDLVVGGSPCQSFSIAGDRTGLEGASGLMWEYVRCVRELMPRWILWENVPGALSSGHGEDFRCLLEALDALGYGLAWRVLDAQFFGVAQRRERVFVVGRLGDVDGPCKVLFEPESLQWDSQSSREKRQELAARAGGGAACAGGALNPADPQSRRVFSPRGAAPTLDATEQPSVLCAGFKHNPAVMCMTDTQPHSMVDGEVCGALIATMHKDPPVVAKTLKIRGGCEGGGKGPLVQEDISATLGTGNDQTLFEPVSFAANQRGELRLQGGDGTVVGAVPANRSGKQVQLVMDGYVVRRLTPRECERLMGMPDDWTKVPYRGKPADECPDTPRYKAIGNSMAVNVMRWIGMRIQEAES